MKQRNNSGISAGNSGGNSDVIATFSGIISGIFATQSTKKRKSVFLFEHRRVAYCFGIS